MKYILVLQWPGNTMADFDALIAMEDQLLEELPEDHGVVDGHDFGVGEMNIFVRTDRPLDAFHDAMKSLSTDPRWANVRAAYRPIHGDHFVTVWPKTLEEFTVS